MSDVPWYARFLLRSTDWAWSLHTGYNTPFLEAIAASYGLGKTFRLLGAMTASTKKLEASFGAVEAQLVLGIAGTWNGCRFCGAGHVYAANLLYYRRHEALLPLDEREVFDLQTLSFDELVAGINSRFEESEGPARELAPVVRRTFEMEQGARSDESEGDRAIGAAIETWNHLNECSVETVYDFEVQVIPALATVYKDKALIRRYQAARGRA